MAIPELVRQILQEFRGKKGELAKEEWEAVANIVTEMIPPFPNLPGPLFVPVMSRCVPANIELVMPRDGKVLLTKRKWFDEVAYHTPGTYIAPGETFLQTAQRCADRELKVRVVSAEPMGPAVNHPVHPRFHDLAVLLRCEIEGKPQVGEWFDSRPPMLGVHKDYWQHIEPLLK